MDRVEVCPPDRLLPIAQNVWFNASITDINPEKNMFSVSYVDHVWADEVLPAHCVRSAGAMVPGLQCQADDEIEVPVYATADHPSGWAPAVVQREKAGFLFCMIDYENGPVEQIVQQENVRPRNVAKPMNLNSLTRDVLPIDEELRGWAESEDVNGCIAAIKEKTGCYRICISLKPLEMVFLGEPKDVRRSILLGEVHLKHQRGIFQFQQRRERKMKILEERRLERENTKVASFAIGASLVGIVIGKSGENLRRVEEAHNVSISVSQDREEIMRQIVIYGETQEACDAARSEIEYITHDYPIDNKLVGWMLGKQFKNIDDIKARCGLHHAKWFSGHGILELCGLRPCIDDAIVMLDSHAQYYDVYQEMERENATINKSFEELDGKGRRDKGKGKGEKGKGKDRAYPESNEVDHSEKKGKGEKKKPERAVKINTDDPAMFPNLGAARKK